jgi:hypothetical protein
MHDWVLKILSYYMAFIGVFAGVTAIFILGIVFWALSTGRYKRYKID